MLEDTVQMRKAKAREFNSFIDRVGKELTMTESNFRAIVRILMANPGRLTTEAIIKLIFDASDDFLSAAQSAELISRLSGIAIHRIQASPAVGTHLAFAHAVGLVEWLSMLSCDRWNLAHDTHHQGACYYAVTRIWMAPPVELLGRDYPRYYFGLDWGETYSYREARPRIMRSVLERQPRGGLRYHGSPAIQPPWVDAIVNKVQARVQRRLGALAQANGGIAYLEFLADRTQKEERDRRGPVLPQPKLITGGEMRPLALTPA